MAIFLILAPFGAFATLTLLTSLSVSLFASAGVALATVIYDLVRGHSIKILASSAMVLFGALGGYVTLIDPGCTAPTIRLALDSGILAISLLSIAFRFPFTLQYAREIVDVETTKLPGFMSVNYIIAWAWTAAFALMVFGGVLAIYVPGLPLWAGIVVAFAARNGATLFTKWYPNHRRAIAAKQALPGPMVSAS